MENQEINVSDMPTTATIAIRPEESLAVVNLAEEVRKLKEYAVTRTIKTDLDIKPFTDDLSLIANLKKAVKEKQDEYVKPIKAHLESVKLIFDGILTMLNDADTINRQKIKVYRDEQLRRQAEAEELNRQAQELARKQAEFSGTGEFMVNTTPVEAAPVINKVSTDMGTVSTQKVWKWEIEDMSKVPVEYLIIDAAKIGKVVRAGLRNIPGIKIYCDETIRVNSRVPAPAAKPEGK